MPSVLHRVVVMLLCLLPSALEALGVGGIEISSGLTQPFDAKIPIIGAKQEELADVKAVLAEQGVFDRAGLARPYSLNVLKFEVVPGEDGSGYIHITSRDSMREPALEFIIEVKWRNGNLQRMYSVLLEPK